MENFSPDSLYREMASMGQMTRMGRKKRKRQAGNIEVQRRQIPEAQQNGQSYRRRPRPVLFRLFATLAV